MGRRVFLYARVNAADDGGVQAVFRRLAAHLGARGHDVTRAWALGACTPGELSYEFRPPIFRGRWPAPRSTLWAGGALLRLASAFLRTRPDVVNVHYVTGDALYFALLKRVFGYRLVLSFHGSDILRPQEPDVPLLPAIARRADAVTAVSHVAADRVRALAGVDHGRVHVVPNGIDWAFWSGVPRAEGAGAPLVVSVGRLDPVKGHDVLLRAFPAVVGRVAGARLVIVGAGGSRGDLVALAERLGIGAAVEFTGQLSAEVIRTLLSRARVFVLPSRSEGLPLALLEAMAAAVPVVATAVGGAPEVVTAGSGVLVPPEDPAALAEAISRMLHDGAAAAVFGRNARARAAAFTAEAADAAYERLLVGSDGGQSGVRPGSNHGLTPV